MIEIITEPVEMPDFYKRRFQKHIEEKGNKWLVVDTDTNKQVYIGSFENASIACHNLNKKYYKNLKENK